MRKILGCFISEKLVYKRESCDHPIHGTIQVLFKISKVLQGSKNKKEVENNLLSTLAPQAAESCNRMKDLLNVEFTKCTSQ